MKTIDIIKNLCQQQGISIKTLEQNLGFSNGSLAKNNCLRSDRLLAVAQYFNVSMEYLMGVVDENDNILRPITLSEFENLQKAAGRFDYNSIIQCMGFKIDYKGGKYYILSNQDEYGDYHRRVSVSESEIDSLNHEIDEFISFKVNQLYNQKRDSEEKGLAS